MKKLKLDKTLDVAESERDDTAHKGFVAGLFEGSADFDYIYPYPQAFSPSSHDIVKEEEFLHNLQKVLEEKVDSEYIDSTGEIPQEVFDALINIGAFGIKIPEEYGGLGLSQSGYCRAATLLGSYDASITALLSAHNSIGLSQPLLQFGSERQKSTYLPQIANGAICAFALTEEDAGSDLTRIRTYAKRIKDPASGKALAYKINGKKIYTTNGPRDDNNPLARFIVVIARVVDDVSEIDDPDAKPCFGAFIVDTRKPGFEIGCRSDFMGIKGIYNGVTLYNDVTVSREDVLGSERDGIRIALSTLAIGRLTLPAACLGGMKKALSTSRWWAGERVQWFETSLAEKELIAKKIADMAGNTFALEAMVGLSSYWVDKKEDVRLESAVCKVFGSEWLWSAANDALQIRSGRGYETDSSLVKRGESPDSLERILRDARVNLIFEGTNEVMRLWVSREGMDAYANLGEDILLGDALSKAKAVLGITRRFLSLPGLYNKKDIPHPLRKHIRFVEREAGKLARLAITSSAVWQKKIIHKQLAVSRLVETSMELFAITAACSYAAKLDKQGFDNVIEIADYFCAESRKRIHPSHSTFKQVLWDAGKSKALDVAKIVVNKDCLWLENGAVLNNYSQYFEDQETR